MHGLNSLSSSLIYGTTLYRNQPGVMNKAMAIPGYALCAVVAAVETVAVAAFTTISLAAYPFSSTPFERSGQWLGSSTFSLGWAITDFLLNPVVDRLVADERSARMILQSGNLMIIPQGAHI